jgi:mono/diheme cytochrome c family protein
MSMFRRLSSRVVAASFSVAAAAFSIAATTSVAVAEPASSPQSAWTNSTLQSDAALKSPLARRGKEVFQARCEACHGALPPVEKYGLAAMPGTAALALKYKSAKPAELERRTDLTPDFVAVFVRKGVGIMPPFRPTELSNDDLKALGAYLSRKQR